jgi:ribonuclease HII
MPPTNEFEQTLFAAGHSHIAGIDEAGRGCWAGPVVAAAVVFPKAVLLDTTLLVGIDDSKRLSATRRLILADQIKQLALAWGVGSVPAHVIDTHGILHATRVAMQIALLRMPLLPSALLIDAVKLDWPGQHLSLIRGDARSISIAAASILAKVSRDQQLATYEIAYPAYGFAEHKGYGTAAHEQALHQYGATSQHRRTFRPLQAFLTSGIWPASGHTTSATIVPHLQEQEEEHAY